MSDNPKFKYMHLNRELDFWEKLYLPEILRGMSVTLGHFLSNWPFFRREKNRHERIPGREVRHLLPNSWPSLPDTSFGWLHHLRGLPDVRDGLPGERYHHRTARRIEPYYTGRQKIDRRPKTFVIDQLSCIYCGFCVQACPEDAIRMDSGHPAMAIHTREQAIVNRDLLLEMKNIKEGQHNIVFNPIPGKEPAQAPLTVLPTEEAQQREY